MTTTPEPPNDPVAPPLSQKKLAKDVAKQLDRRQRTRKLLLLLLLAAAIALAVMYGTCGKGWGLGGGKGKGAGSGPGPGSARGVIATVADAGTAPKCAVRLSPEGLTLDGAPAKVEDIAASCKTRQAEVVITGDTLRGDADNLRTALTTANVVWEERAVGNAGSGSGSGGSGSSL